MEKLDLIIESLKELKEDNKEQHGAIIKRLDHTNGRVRSLEVWRSFIVGGLTILGIMVPIGIKFIK